MKVEVKNLVRSFGPTLAVNDVSFDFSSGDIFGFIGPNGAGKTTTIKIMATLDQPDSGDVFFDGVSAVMYPEKVRHCVGYMPDSLPAYRDIEVWEYLDFFARSFGLRGEKRTRTLAEIEEFTKLGEIRHKYLASLSKGLKQRVSLARALVHNPQVLIMDEPAAGLDPRARLELRELLKILAGQGKAILLSSHILSELQDICNGAVIIEKGNLLSAGSLKNLLSAANGKDSTVSESVSVETCIVLIKVGGQLDAAKLKLLEHPLVALATIENERALRVQVRGGDDEISQVVGSLFNAGIPVIGFDKIEIGLEEIFMKITTGKVQ